MRTYKEPKRIDKPRGREPGIVNPAEYMHRLAASYQQKNNAESSISNTEAASPTDNNVDALIDQPDANGEVESPSTVNDVNDDGDTAEALDLSSSNIKNICPVEPVLDGPKIIEPEENCVGLAEPPNAAESESPPKSNIDSIEEVVKEIEPSPKGGKKKVSPKQKSPKIQKAEKMREIAAVIESKKKSQKVSKQNAVKVTEEEEGEHNGLNFDLNDLPSDQPPTKKKKSSPKGKKAAKQISKPTTEQLTIETEEDKDGKSETASDPSLSPRVSKRTPKKNRKYQSDEEEKKLSPREELEAARKKSGKIGKAGLKVGRKRKLLFEDEDEEEDNVVQVEEPVVKKPPVKKRKKGEEKEKKEIAKTPGKKKTVKRGKNKTIEANQENVEETDNTVTLEQDSKCTSKDQLESENVPEEEEKLNDNNKTEKTEKSAKVVKARKPKKLKNKAPKDGVVLDSSAKPGTSAEIVPGTDSVAVKNSGESEQAPGEQEEKPEKQEQKGILKKKKAAKKKKSIGKPGSQTANEEKGNGSNDTCTSVTGDTPNEEKESDDKENEQKETGDRDNADREKDNEKKEGEDIKETPKKEQVVITCQHCGHISHSKSANTRHTRKCVVSIIKGELQSSPRARGEGGSGGDGGQNALDAAEDEKKEGIESLLLKDSTLKKVETPGENEGLYMCEHCTYGTPKRAMLARHMRTHGIYVCLRCNFICDTQDGLKDHCHREHKDRTDFKLCRKCSRYVKCETITLEKHMEDCTGPVPFVCQHCDKEFKYESSLKSHIIRHNPEAPKRFHCEVCSYESNYKANLKKHMTNIHEDKVKNVKCLHEECKKMFYTEDSMRRHLKWHSEERPFKCPNCEKQFKTMTALKGHKVIHDPARPFKCNIDECTKDFRSKKHLKNHQEEFHQFAEKKFLCEYEGCTFAFFKKSHLERHVITHTGERKYGCWICGRGFRHTDNLKIHMRTHTDEKPVKCDLCDFACRQKSSLQYHLRKFHGILPPPKKKGKRKDLISPSSSHSVNGAVKKLDSNGDLKSSEKKPLSPNRSQNALDLYEFKSDDDLDDDTLMMPLWQDKSSPNKTFHIDHNSSVDKGETSANKNNDPDDKVEEDEELPKIERTDSTTTIEGGLMDEEEKKENENKVKKKTVKRKRKTKKDTKVDTELEAEKDLEEQTLEDAVKQVLKEQEEEPVEPTPAKGRKKKKQNARSPKEAKSPARSPGRSPRRSPARKEKKGKEKVQEEVEEESPSPPKPVRKGRKGKKAAAKSPPKSPKSPVAASKKTSPVVKRKSRKRTKKKKNVDDQEEVENEDTQEIKSVENQNQSNVKDDQEEETAENVEETGATVQSRAEENDEDEDNNLSSNEAEVVETVNTNKEEVKEDEKPEEEEDDKTVIPDTAVDNAPPEMELKKESDIESDGMSSGIDTDFEEELKPPPAPRPPPVVDSDDGDIESGPDDMDTPGRDFESTPPKSVALSDHIHSVPSHTPGGGDGSESMPHSNYGMVDSVKPPDSVSEVNKETEFSESMPVSIPTAEVTAQKESPAGTSVTVQANNNTGDYGGSQSESTMPEVDKDYLGQYLQQFDAAGRSEDEVTRLDVATDRPIDIPPPQDKDLPPLNLSSSAPPLNLSTNSDSQREDMHSQGSDMSNKRMEILACDRQHEDHFQATREGESPSRSTERIPDNVYDSISAMNSSFVPTSRETPVIRQTENIFPPSTTASSSFMRFTESDALLQRQRMTTPFLSQSDPNALQNLHRMADSALGTHNNTASSLLRRPTTVPPREDMFTGPTAVAAQSMARNPFNSWPGQDVRPPYWGQPPHLQRAIDRQSNSTSSSLFPKDNYLSRDLMFETSRRTMTERNMFSGLTQSQRPEIPHETFPLERFDFGYFGGHGYPTAPSLDYTRSQCGTAAQKSFDERYRQTATGVSDFRTLPQTSTSEMFSSMNSSFNLDKYMYGRDPIYHTQHMGDSTNSPFLPHGVAPQHAMFDREYPPRGFYQNTPYSFVNMNDKQYAAAAAASAKLPHPSSSGVTQERDFVPRPNTGAASATDNQIQDPYRNPLLYNMMNRYFE